MRTVVGDEMGHFAPNSAENTGGVYHAPPNTLYAIGLNVHPVGASMQGPTMPCAAPQIGHPTVDTAAIIHQEAGSLWRA